MELGGGGRGKGARIQEVSAVFCRGRAEHGCDTSIKAENTGWGGWGGALVSAGQRRDREV